MAKTNGKRKRNPSGAVLVNPRKKAKASKKSIPLRDLFAAAGGLKKNGKKRRKASSKRRNPLMVRTNGKKRRKASSKKRRNPLMVRTNGRRRGSRRKTRRNPLMVRTNGRRRRRTRRNPAVVRGFLGFLNKIPFVGPILAQAASSLGAAAFGGIAAIPHYFAGKAVGDRVPSLLKPVQYSLFGAVTSAVLKKVLPNFKYKNELCLSIAVAGGTIDGWRALNSKMGALAGDDGGYGDAYGEIDGDEMGEADMGADDGFGTAEDVRPAEYADADLNDAEYSGDDLSADEIEWAGYGRAAFRKKFMRQRGGARHQGASRHAGQPGVRWGWLVYWIGFDQFKVLANLPEGRRKEVIHKARHAALQAARQAVQALPDTTVATAETAGLLAME